MEEVLTRLLKKGFKDGHIKNYFHPRGAPIISHLLYADDLLVFIDGGKRSVKELLHILEKYERFLGQSMNKAKFALFMSNKISTSRRR